MSIREDDAAVEDGADDLQKSTSSADKSSERCDLPFTPVPTCLRLLLYVI